MGNVPSVTRKLVDRADVGGLVGIRVERKVFGDLPDKDLVTREYQRCARLGVEGQEAPCRRRSQRQ